MTTYTITYRFTPVTKSIANAESAWSAVPRAPDEIEAPLGLTFVSDTISPDLPMVKRVFVFTSPNAALAGVLQDLYTSWFARQLATTVKCDPVAVT